MKPKQKKRKKQACKFTSRDQKPLLALIQPRQLVPSEFTHLLFTGETIRDKDVGSNTYELEKF